MKKLLSGILAFTMLLSMMVISPAVSAEGEDPVVSRFVVASDVHVNLTGHADYKYAERIPHIFEYAYAYAEGHEEYQKIDAFVFNGDTVDGSTAEATAANSNINQWKTFMSLVKENIRSGSKFIIDLAKTHDIADSSGNAVRITEEEFNGILTETFGEDSEFIANDWGYGLHVSEVNGQFIITLTNDMSTLASIKYDDYLEELDEALKTLTREHPEKPIFVMAHYPDISNKLGGVGQWGTNSFSNTLSKYPQAILINGHIHWDPRHTDAIYQKDYTAIYDGAVAYTVFEGGSNNADSDSSSDVTSYMVVEVTASGKVQARYINTDTGEFLKRADGSEEELVYTIEKAWDPGTYTYTDAYRLANSKTAYFAEDASIRLENGDTLVFDRAITEEPMRFYTLELFDGETTVTQEVSSRLVVSPLPNQLSAKVILEAGKTYTATVYGTDGMDRETLNALSLTFTTEDTDLMSTTGIKAPTDAITVSTAAELRQVLDAIAGGESYEGKTIVQTADIDLENKLLSVGGVFNGTFDGNGFTITGLYSETGLFKGTDGALLKNLNVCGTVISNDSAAGIAADAVNTTFENCMNGVVVVSLGGNAASYASYAESCTFINCIYDGSLLAPNGNTVENESTNASSAAVTVADDQLIFHTENGDIKRALSDGSRAVDWSYDTLIDSAEEFINWLLQGAPEATLTAHIDLNKLTGRYALLANTGLTFRVNLDGGNYVIRGGDMTLLGASSLGATDLILNEGTNCWDADDFTAEQLAGGEAAYLLGSWGQYEGTPAGEGKLVMITYEYPDDKQVFYVEAGTQIEVEIPHGYTASSTAFTANEDTVVTFTSHNADKTALGAAYDKYSVLHANVFTEPTAFEAAIAAAKAVLDNLTATEEDTANALTALENAMTGLTLALDTYENYPEFEHYQTYTELYGTIKKWSLGTKADLDVLSAESKSYHFPDYEFHMTADIDMEWDNFGMIGNSAKNFCADFDGHFHTVSNLYINSEELIGAGFFSHVYNHTIQNFGITNGYVRAAVSRKADVNHNNMGVAAVAGAASATAFRHVWNGADVVPYARYIKTASICYAGIAGRATGDTSFVGCYNLGDICGYSRASGITNWGTSGTSAARISNCFNLGEITTLTGDPTEAIARYGASETYPSYVNYNNYYLKGSADCAISISGTEADLSESSTGAEAPVALTAEQFKTESAERLNQKALTGYYADIATWVQGPDGYPIIESLNEENDVIPFSEYSDNKSAKYYSISTPDELNAFAAASKESDFNGVTIYLKDSIDMSGTAGFAMIGNSTYKFAGTFDGRGNTISGLTMAIKNYTGMFTYTDGATLKNFTLSGAEMSGSTEVGRVGLLVGRGLSTTIDNVHIANSTMTSSYTSSIYRYSFFVGEFYGGTNTVTNCTSVGNSVTSKGIQGFGCFVGYNSNEATETTVKHCAAINNTLSIRFNCGVLAGYVHGGALIIDDCFTYGNSLTTKNTGVDSKKLGAAIGNTTGTVAATIKNSVFTDDNVLVGCTTLEPNVTNTYAINSYTNDNSKPSVELATPATVITAAQIESGEMAYKMGWALKDGKLAFADKDTAAAQRVTYKIEGQEDIVRYTDSNGEIINRPENPTHDTLLFNGWRITDDPEGRADDKLYTAVFATEDTGTWPLSEHEFHLLAKSFTISCEEELNLLATLSKSNSFAGYTFTLIDDIDMSGTADFAMIGNSTYKFAGTFDGQGYTVSGLTVATSANYNGMFRYVTDGTIKDLTLSKMSLKGGAQSGLLIGQADRVTVDNVHIAGATFTAGGANVGGIIGRENASEAGTKITNCSVDGLTFGSDKQGMGGFIGYAKFAEIDSCYVINSTINSRANSGLFIGYALNVSLNNCFTYNNTLTYLASKGASANNIGSAVGQAYETDGDGVIVTNSVFCEDYLPIVDYIRNTTNEDGSVTYTGKADVDAETVYSIANAQLVNVEDDSDNLFGTTITRTQITNGEVSYLMGWALKAGNLAFTDEDTLAAKKYTYQVNGAVSAIRYTDYTGAIIGEAVECPVPDGWTETTLENGDKLFVANTVLPYDINEDGSLDTADAIMLLKYIDGHDVPVNPDVADINGDGKVKVFDAVRLLQILRDGI